jgi:hypothetical protein
MNIQLVIGQMTRKRKTLHGMNKKHSAEVFDRKRYVKRKERKKPKGKDSRGRRTQLLEVDHVLRQVSDVGPRFDSMIKGGQLSLHSYLPL